MSTDSAEQHHHIGCDCYDRASKIIDANDVALQRACTAYDQECGGPFVVLMVDRAGTLFEKIAGMLQEIHPGFQPDKSESAPALVLALPTYVLPVFVPVRTWPTMLEQVQESIDGSLTPCVVLFDARAIVIDLESFLQMDRSLN